MSSNKQDRVATSPRLLLHQVRLATVGPTAKDFATGSNTQLPANERAEKEMLELVVLLPLLSVACACAV